MSVAAAPYADALTAALVEGDAPAAEELVVSAMRAGLRPPDVLVEVICPAMQAIGELWEHAELTIAQEHLATGICEGLLAAVYPALLHRRHDRGEVVVAAPQGERHVLGLRMVADLLEGAGFRASFVGADAPPEALARLVAARQPVAVALGITLDIHRDALRRAARALLEADPQTWFILGGAACDASLADELGASYAADAREVVALAEIAAAASPERGVPAEPLRAAPRPAAEDPTELLVVASSHAAEVARRHARVAVAFEQLALEDPLTRVGNRRAFDDGFAALAAQPGEHALVLIDLDGFKAINDTFGHDAGDQLLVEVAAALDAERRAGDLVARLGGDEFAVLLRDTAADAACEVAERLRAIVDRRTGGRMTVSAGVTSLDGDARATLLRADRALLDVKRAGRDAVARA